MENKMNRFIHGALILTLAGLFSKILSALYRIPIQNFTGDIGFYIYQQIYPLIATIVILSLYSFPAAISKIGAEIGEKRNSFTYFFLPNVLLLIILNGAIFIIIYLLAPIISLTVGDGQLAKSYRYLAFAFLIIPFISIFCGFFQAEEHMETTAISQVIEQIFRVSLIIITAYLIFNGQANLYRIGEMGALATVIGMGCATLYLLYKFIVRQKKGYGVTARNEKVPITYYLRTIIFFGIAVSFNHMIFIMMQFGDMFTLIPNLIKGGVSLEEAMIWKGIFDRGVPLIQLGIVVGSSFALALIPTVAAQQLNREKLHGSVQNAIAFSCYLGLGATVGLIILFPETNILLFQSDEGIQSIRLFVVAIVILSVTITANAILQSMGHLIKTSLFIVATFLLKVILNVYFVPKYGLLGASISTISSLGLLGIVTLYMLKKILPKGNVFKKLNITALMIASSGMVIYLFVFKWIVPLNVLSRGMMLFYVSFLVMSGAIIYFFLLIRFKAFTEAQLNVLPFSSKIKKLSNILMKR